MYNLQTENKQEIKKNWPFTCAVFTESSESSKKLLSCCFLLTPGSRTNKNTKIMIFDWQNYLPSLNNGPNFCSMHTKCHRRKNNRAFNLKTLGEISVLKLPKCLRKQYRKPTAEAKRSNQSETLLPFTYHFKSFTWTLQHKKNHSLVHNVAGEEEGLNDDEDHKVCGRETGGQRRKFRTFHFLCRILKIVTNKKKGGGGGGMGYW